MLKLQYFGHLRQRADSLEKTLMLGKIEGRRREQQRMRWLDEMVHQRLDGHEFEQARRGGDEQGSPVVCSPWGSELERTERPNGGAACGTPW